MVVLDLTPFHLGEVPDVDRLWRWGGFPDGGVLGEPVYPVWQESYLRAMAERDLPNWGLPAKPLLTQRLFRMVAGLVKGTRQVLICRVSESLTRGNRWVTRLEDYLAASSASPAQQPAA
jgi:hypothetical protein